MIRYILLSEGEVFEYRDNYSIVIEGTDYAKAQGLYSPTNSKNTNPDEWGKSNWLTRTPSLVTEEDLDDVSASLISYVKTSGRASINEYPNGFVSVTTHGVRPICWIKL